MHEVELNLCGERCLVFCWWTVKTSVSVRSAVQRVVCFVCWLLLHPGNFSCFLDSFFLHLFSSRLGSCARICVVVLFFATSTYF